MAIGDLVATLGLSPNLSGVTYSISSPDDSFVLQSGNQVDQAENLASGNYSLLPTASGTGFAVSYIFQLKYIAPPVPPAVFLDDVNLNELEDVSGNLLAQV